MLGVQRRAAYKGASDEYIQLSPLSPLGVKLTSLRILGFVLGTNAEEMMACVDVDI